LKRSDLPAAAGCAGVALGWAVMPALLLALTIGSSVHDHFAFDFHQFWQGGRDVLHGVSPYPPRAALATASDRLDPFQTQQVFRFPYPAPVAVVLVPLGALPFGVAAAIFLALSAGALLWSLRLLGVPDWRCYAVVLCWPSTLSALRLGSLTPLLLLAAALVWRYRDRPGRAGIALAAAVVAKLYLWPLLLWALLTRRPRAALLASGCVVGALFTGWAVLGFAGLTEYPQLLSALAASMETRGYSAIAIGRSAGLSAHAAELAARALGALVLLCVVAVARRANGDRRVFILAVAASLLLSPIVWLQYFVLLVVPIALARRSVGPLWLVPLLQWFFVSPFHATGADLWRIGFGATIAVSVFLAGDLVRPSAPSRWRGVFLSGGSRA
jgi:alpha-1,2-mannosyltransferase